MLSDGLCNYRTVIRALELILLFAGIISTIFIFKRAFENYFCYEFVILTLRNPWFYFRSWLSSPFYICIIINFIVVFIAASSLFHHHHHSRRKIDNPASVNSDGSEEDNIVFESSLTELLSPLPPPDLPAPPPENHIHNDLWQDVHQFQPFASKNTNGMEKQEQQAEEEEEEEEDPNAVTMEETWRAINGGENPEKKELKKSETWPQPPQLAVPEGVFHCQLLQEELNQEESTAKKKKKMMMVKKDLKKSMTFNDTVSVRCRGGLMRDPSMSLEEFNGKVEAFIKKFNNEMKLQRQESEQRFLEMINRSI